MLTLSKPHQSFVSLIYANRDLLRILVRSDLQSRYRKSYLGIIWTLLNPILSSLVIWIVFVSIFKSKLSHGTQFAPYLLAGVLTITFFNQGLMTAAESISNGTRLFLRVRVDPKLFCVSNTLVSGVNFFIGITTLALVSWISGAAISIKFPLIIFVGLCLTMLTIGCGLIFSILFIRFNDVKYIMTILLQLLTYLTPVFYPKEILNNQVRLLVTLNPLTSYLDVFRHVFNGTEVATVFDWVYMFGSSILVFVLGTFVFRKFWDRTVVML